MKIFGKVKSSSAAATSVAEKKDDPKKDQIDVQSYFAYAEETPSKKKKQKKSDALDGDNIDVLLKMDFSTLNSKQRRLIKRHKAREGNLEGNQEADEIKPSSGNNEQNSSSKGKEEVIEQHIEVEAKCITNDMSNAADINTTKSSMDISEIVKKLDGLNSKERRKFLRQLKSNGQDIDEQVLAAAQDEAKKVAERNEKEANSTSSTKGASDSNEGKRKDSSEPSASNNETSKPKKKRRKKNAVNLEDLPPEERARREEQRRMQKEAAERRAAGLVDPNRHPLNSERRRANRRKPGKAAQIAQAKKERMADGGKFNAVGYQMRKGAN